MSVCLEGGQVSATLFATRRNGVVERLERGHCVLANALGTIVWSVGDPDHVTYMRSSAKPIQTSALILSGGADRFGLEPEHLGVCCGSPTRDAQKQTKHKRPATYHNHISYHRVCF